MAKKLLLILCCLIYYNLVLSHEQTPNVQKLESDSLKQVILHLNKSQLDSASTLLFDKAHWQYKLSDTELPLLYYGKGWFYYKLGDLSTSINHFNNGIGLAKKLPNYNYLATLLNYKGNWSDRYAEQSGLKQYFDSTKVYLKQALQHHNADIDVIDFHTILYNLGSNYAYTKQYDSARAYFHLFLNNAINNNLPQSIGSAYYNIGTTYYEQELDDSASYYYNKALVLAKKYNSSSSQVLSLNGLANINMYAGNYNKAIELGLQALPIAQKSQSIKLEKDVYNVLRANYDSLGNNKQALLATQQYFKLQNDIAGKKKIQEIEALQANIKVERAQIDKEKIEAVSNKRKRTNNLLLVTAASLLVGLIGMGLYLNNRVKVNNAIAEKNKAEYESRINDILRSGENRYINAFILGKEKERKRIAKDLHDSIGSMLSTVKLYFSSLESKVKYLETKNVAQYEKANELLDSAVQQVREISHDMVSGTLMQFGLQNALTELANGIQQSTEVRYIVNLNNSLVDLPGEYEIHLYRIVQELTNNTLKHAKATMITLSSEIIENTVHLNYRDNGIGYNPSALKAGIGLKNLAERIAELNGRFTDESAINKGTSINIVIPQIKNTLT